MNGLYPVCLGFVKLVDQVLETIICFELIAWNINSTDKYETIALNLQFFIWKSLNFLTYHNSLIQKKTEVKKC